MCLKLLQKTTGNLIVNKIANEISKVSRNSPQNNSETVEIETEIPKERYVSPEKRQKIISSTDNPINFN